ncbi:MAG TPA: DUF2155 domain-containing protein [Xanthobacteraceae bacterium]|jgi:hypothetical protein
MARPLRAVSLIALAAALGGPPAAAQFNPFEALFGAPPRPPSSVPAGRQQAPQAYPQYPEQQYPDPRYRDQRYPEQYPGQQQYPDQAGIARQGPSDGAIQSQPLPPPPGGTVAAVPPGQPLPGSGQAPLRSVPQPADTSPQPGDEVIAEPPSQKIANKQAVFSGLDKITGRIINFDATIGETVQFGALQVTPRVCYTRPPTETPNTDAFIEVDEVTLQGEVKRIFTGWMFASSPGLHAVEHPIYDVWLTDCKDAVVAAAPQAEPAAAPAVPPAKPAAPAQRRPPPQPSASAAPRR